MSENNSFDESKEPIESIEKTVEDLKKKIQELSSEEESEIVEEEKENKVSQLKENATETISQGIQDVKEKVTEIAQNKDIQKTVSFIKENAVKARKTAVDKYNILKNDENVQNAQLKASETIERVSTYAKQKTTDAYNQLDDHTKATISSTCKKITNVVKDGVENAKEFYQRDDVQEKLTDIKKSTNELYERGLSKIKGLLKK